MNEPSVVIGIIVAVVGIGGVIVIGLIIASIMDKDDNK